MFVRCYSKIYQAECPTYKGCSVCEEWHLFSNFKKWFDDNYKVGYALDKDIIIQGNKVYSPATCCFVPQRINNLLTDHRAARGQNAIGVNFSKKLNKFIARYSSKGKSIHIGCFDTEHEAYEAYKQAKYSEIKRVAKESLEKGEIDIKVYNALLDYKISED